MRIFIAIELPEHVKSKIFHRFENIEKNNLFNGKFTKKDNLHLTLKFFGEISEEKIGEIKEKLKEIKLEKLKIDIGKAGFFNNENFIKVIWIEVLSENKKIQEIHKLISDKFPETNSDYKEFNPHITIARVNNIPFKVNKEKLVNEIREINFKDLSFDVDKFVLMKSELMKSKSEGIKYKILEEFDL